MGRGPTRGFTRKMPPGCNLDITKYKIESPGKSPLSQGSGGGGWLQLSDSSILLKCLVFLQGARTADRAIWGIAQYIDLF